MNVAIEIPDDIGKVLSDHKHDLSRAVLEAVAVQGYRSGKITTAQVQSILVSTRGGRSRSFWSMSKAYHDYTIDDLDGELKTYQTKQRDSSL